MFKLTSLGHSDSKPGPGLQDNDAGGGVKLQESTFSLSRVSFDMLLSSWLLIALSSPIIKSRLELSHRCGGRAGVEQCLLGLGASNRLLPGTRLYAALVSVRPLSGSVCISQTSWFK